MDLSTIAVDLDGTFRSPLVVTVVSVYSLLLSVCAALLVVAWRKRSRQRWILLSAGLAVFLAALLNGPAARFLIAILVEAPWRDGPSVGVGFFGHHPTWLTPLLVFSGAIIGYIKAQAIRLRQVA